MIVEQDAALNEDVMDAAAMRTVVLASADAGLRQRLRSFADGTAVAGARGAGGAEAMAQLEDSRPEALLVDSWLPDLEVGEFARSDSHDVSGDGADAHGWWRRMGGARSPRRNELLHALREAQDAPLNDTRLALETVRLPVGAASASVLLRRFAEVG